jgi:hypothetical protein
MLAETMPSDLNAEVAKGAENFLCVLRELRV